MEFKKSIIILIISIFLVSIASVSASDANDTAVVSEDAPMIEVAQTDGVNANDDSQAIEQPNDEEKISEENVGTFSELQNNITAKYGSTLELDRNYEYDDGFDTNGIKIKQNITIDGKGHAIDAKGKSRVFVIYASDVTIKNLTIKNAYYNGDCGAVYFVQSGSAINCNFVNNVASGHGGAILFYNGGDVTNCNFANNTASKRGGAIYFSNMGNVTSCNFANNSGYYGGAIYFASSGTVEDCNFTNNWANSDASFGGAICFNKNMGNVTNCNFANNSARYAGAIYMYYGTVENCNFDYNKASDRGGAIYFSKYGSIHAVTSCNFTNNRANGDDSWGGAIFITSNGIASNCNFDNNSANGGGAMYLGSAVNCTFSGNAAGENGGAIYQGSAMNCTFSGNSAPNVGGAMFYGSAVNCTFSGNTAAFGGAMYRGYKMNCSGQNDYCETQNLVLLWDANNFTTVYGSGEKLPIQLKDPNKYLVGFINYDVVIYKNGAYVKTYHCLSNDELAIDLLPGIYTAVLTVTYPGINQPEPKNITLTINTDGTTFTDLNKAINDNTNATITLDNDYAFNSDIDSAFKDGVAINRKVTINGNGHTIDAKGKSKIFFVAVGNVTIENITFLNGNSKAGGAIEAWVDNCTVSGCSFKNNHAEEGGAISWWGTGVKVFNCLFENNSADRNGGAICWFGSCYVSNCIFENNSAGNGSVYYKYFDEPSSYLNGNILLGNGGHELCPGKSDDCNFNWFGHTADDYLLPPAFDKVNITVWMFLNVTAALNAISVSSAYDVVFKLYIYNSTSGNITEYDNAPFKNLNLTITATNGNVSKNIAKLGEPITYTLTSIGIGTVTAKIENVEYAIEFDGRLNPNLSIDSQEADYSNSTIIAINYNSTATGTVNITLKGKNGNNYTFTDLTLNATILLPEAINADEYWVNVTYSGNTVFLNATANGTFTVNKANSTLTINDNVVFDYNTNGSTTVSFTNASGVNASVMNHPNAAVDVVGNTITVSGLDAGSYTLIVTTITNNNYNNVTETADITVNKANSTLTINNIAFDYGAEGSCEVSFTNATGVNASVIGQPKAIVNVTDTTITVSGLAAGNYTLSVTTITDGNHNNVTKTANITVNKASTEITVNPASLDLFVGDETVIVANLTPADAGNVTFTSSNDTIVSVDAQGNVIAQGKGQAIITVSFAGDNNYAAAENRTVTVTVSLNNANVTVDKDNLDLKVGETYAINATKHPDTIFLDITYTSSNNAVVTVDEKGIVTAVGEGTAVITVGVGDDEIYAKNSTNVTVRVSKVPTEIAAKSVTATYNSNKDLIITLKDANGNALSGVNVAVNLKGTKTYTTDKNGQVKVSTKGLAPKKYTAKITFKGNAIYDKSAKDVKVTVKKAKAKITAKKKTYRAKAKTKKFKITLKDKNGKPIKKVKVRLIVQKIKKTTKKKTSKKSKKNKKKNIAKTNKKGKATFKVNRHKKGKYLATVKFYGNKYYAKTVKKVKIKMK